MSIFFRDIRSGFLVNLDIRGKKLNEFLWLVPEILETAKLKSHLSLKSGLYKKVTIKQENWQSEISGFQSSISK